MKVVYLDQNKWIDVVKAFNGRTRDVGLKAAFREIQRLSQQGDAVFPLAWVHYLETSKNRNHESRKRLGTAMWEVSGGHTLASLRKVARFEAETALAKRFPNVTPREFRLVSKGYAHAFDAILPSRTISAPRCPTSSTQWHGSGSSRRNWRRPQSRARVPAATACRP